MTDSLAAPNQGRLFGHPAALFTLFFAEMWERFSYYGMRALLTLYMVKGFLGFNDKESLSVYGAYTALVYMTPFFGGMLADKLLGQRRAVILGGVLMSLGHLTMTIESENIFYAALGMIIVGNGFFKPNISSMVGQLYPPGDNTRRGGFTIFYMGINLGAALSPLLCGYVGETYGWHYGFGLATIGMLIGLAVFWAPTAVAQTLIGAGAVATAGFMVYLQSDESWVLFTIFAGMAVALLVSAGIAMTALARGGLPEHVGAPPEPEKLNAPSPIGLPNQMAVYVCSFVIVPILAILVGSSRTVKIIGPETLEEWENSDSEIVNMFGEIAGSVSTPAGLVLSLAGIVSLIYLLKETFSLQKVARERMFVALILTFFSMVFWSFFEQAGGSMNLFADRNVSRVISDSEITQDDIGKELVFRTALAQPSDNDELADLPPITQEQLGLPFQSESSNLVISTAARLALSDKADVAPEQFDDEREELGKMIESLGRQDRLTMTALTQLRTASGIGKTPDNFDELSGLDIPFEDAKSRVGSVPIVITEEHVGMGIGGTEVPASTFQSANAIFILIFGLVFAWLWGFLRARNLEPNTAVKFALGLLQLGLGFFALYYGASIADERGMVGVAWLLLGYLLHTTGELCLSPVGLSMITELSPKRLVSTMMGTWFLATAFSNYLAAIIGQFTSVDTGEETVIPVPTETVDIYGSVFFKIGVAACAAAAVCFLISPILKKWMHVDEPAPE
ncbi:MAG: peptide MFS transporter [Planctomycetota bacterium]